MTSSRGASGCSEQADERAERDPPDASRAPVSHSTDSGHLRSRCHGLRPPVTVPIPPLAGGFGRMLAGITDRPWPEYRRLGTAHDELNAHEMRTIRPDDGQEARKRSQARKPSTGGRHDSDRCRGLE